MDAKLAADIARLDTMTADELAQETGFAEAAIVLPSTPDDLAYRAALEQRARLAATSTQGENMTTNTQPAVSSDPELIARIQTEQRYVERVRSEQRAAGLQPAVSGDIGYAEWRRNVLRACVCEALGTADCPVHVG